MDCINKKNIDLTLVSGARPNLLESTIKSFLTSANDFNIVNVFVNFDLYKGGWADRLKCQEIVQHHFPFAITRSPERPSFGTAVKWLWSKPVSSWVFHLEDDWLFRAPLKTEFIDVAEDVTQVVLCHKNKKVGMVDQFHYSKTPRYLMGIRFGSRINWRRPLFSCSPCFIRRDFARVVSSFMDPGLDPEKQLNSGKNVRLLDYTQRFQSRLIRGPDPMGFVVDTGRGG